MAQARKRHEAGEFKPHVRTGDEVLVLGGRSVGERGRVHSVEPQRERAIVEGLNTVTKHQKPVGGQTAAASRQQAGRVEKSAPIHVSNLMVICPTCNKPTRIGHKEVGGKSVRSCRKCEANLERSE